MLSVCCLVVMRDEKRLISMTKEQNRSSPVLLQCVRDKNAAATLLFHVKHNLRANMLGAHSGEEQAKEGFV